MRQFLSIITFLVWGGLVSSCAPRPTYYQPHGYDNGYQDRPQENYNRPPPQQNTLPPDYYGQGSSSQRPLTQQEKVRLFYQSCQKVYSFYTRCLPSFARKYTLSGFSEKCTKLILARNKKWIRWHLCVFKSKGYCSSLRACFSTGSGSSTSDGFGSSTF
ncbi:hypothetical protein KKF84_11155 [Myxococcota bacterium]|nr:hypothetical protein [Myxococcota bacterium]